ncbi:hypothetical protein RV15_GL002036 [Enterococcus silesiacus]|nr:hypothetical protein RV15_GL002036 [Enterococcus silesiacus]
MSKKVEKVETVDRFADNFLSSSENQVELNKYFARHFFDAFKGTIDDEGETLTDWLIEVREAFQGKYGPIMKEHSFYIKEEERIIASTVVALFRGVPLVIYVAVDPRDRGRGLAKKLLMNMLNSFYDSIYQDVFLVVTPGNLPAEIIYKQLGFEGVGINWEELLEST